VVFFLSRVSKLGRACAGAALSLAGALVLSPLRADDSPLVSAAPKAEPRFEIVDLHVDLSYEHSYEGHPFELGTGQYAARDLEASGVRGVVLPLFVPARVSAAGPTLGDYERSYSEAFSALAKTPPYSLPGCNGKRVRTWFSFEGAEPLGKDPSRVAEWVARGARLFGLVHKDDNSLAGSSTGKQRGGLTPSGERLVRVIYELGGIVDVSHASDAATRDILKLARSLDKPVVATHSNARALADHPRNLSDELIRGIAASGGVVGLNLHSPYLVRGRAASIADAVAQARYLLRVAGEEHVALGSDFEGDIRPPDGLSDVRGLAALGRALLDAGVSRDAVDRLFSKNALSLLCAGADARL
jgi:membrane dipeptidase